VRDIIVIPGDGIGPEVTRQATQTLAALDLGLRFEVMDHINADTFLRTGTARAGLFEPVHGTAPDIIGRGVANPLAAILSGAMLVEWLGHTAAARAVREAVSATVTAGDCTPDIGGSLSTAQAGAAVRAHLAGATHATTATTCL
jgi:isocitrate/isopropylmalate dehydrogenase